MNRIATLFLASLLLPALMLAQKPGEYPRTMYVSFDKAAVYAEADYTSEIIGTLRLRDSVAVLGSQQKFFQISLGGKRGYVLWSNLSATQAKEKRTGESAMGRTGEGKKKVTVTVPVQDSAAVQVTHTTTIKAEPKHVSSESQLPQCRAMTKAGKQCSRRTADSSGYCWQHKEKH